MINDLLKILADTMQIGLIVLDKNQKIIFHNQVIQSQLPLETKSITNEYFCKAFVELENTRLHEAIVLALRAGFPSVISPKLNRSSLPLYFEGERIEQSIQVRPLQLENKRYCALEITNVSSVIKREKTLIEMARKAHEAKGALRKSEKELAHMNRALISANAELKRISFTDELTGILNRRGFFNEAEKHRLDSIRQQEPFLLFFADLNRLKQINDTYGHDEGDNAIWQCATIIKKTFRNSDIVSRIGGDEFAMLAPGLDQDAALEIMARLQGRFVAYNQSSTKEYELSLSIGFTTFCCENMSSISDLLEQADRKLYAQKTNTPDRQTYHIN